MDIIEMTKIELDIRINKLQNFLEERIKNEKLDIETYISITSRRKELESMLNFINYHESKGI